MKTQIFPNCYKKLGVVIFIVFSFISGGDGAVDGWNEASNTYQPIEDQIQKIEFTPIEVQKSTLFKDYFGENLLHIFEIISIFGIVMYMLSKEKVEDDFIDKLRLESYKLTALFGLFFIIVLYVFSKDLKLSLDYFILLFMSFYLITFYIKKRIY